MARLQGSVFGHFLPGTLLDVDLGPAGEYAVDSSADAGITQEISQLTGPANTQKFTLSCWFKIKSSLHNFILFEAETTDETNAEFNLQTLSGEFRLTCTGEGSDSAIVLLQTNNVNLATDVWYNLLLSVDTTLGTSGWKWYINDAPVTLISETVSTNAFIGLGAETCWWFIANERSSFISLSANICVAAFWFDIDRYTDFSVESNRRKFITAGGRPERLGPDGSTPFDAAPILYFDNPVATWNVNRGTGGNFRFIEGNTLDSNAWVACNDTPDVGPLGDPPA